MQNRRVVLDTNIFLSAHRTKSKGSPNLEIVKRWYKQEFTLLCSRGILMEYEEKLREHNVPEDAIERLLKAIAILGEFVSIRYVHKRYYPSDPDDVEFLLTALEGSASHLVTYDKHLHEIAYRYQDDYLTCEPIVFLDDLRKL